ncbi:hypothetical protein GCM10023310_00020 [Paenibacillus vulneris]
MRQLGLISFSIAGIAYSPYQLLFEYATSRQVMTEAQAVYSTSLKEEQDWAQSMRQAEESNEIHEVGRFQELKRMIPDLTGWIRVQDTLIGYLIVQAQDNDYLINLR